MSETRTAVVTGASRGIGRAIARRLAADHHVVAAARSLDALEELAAEIRSAGGRCTPIELDVRDPEAIARALGAVEADVLVNNAGLGVMKPLVELEPQEWRAMMDVNLDAVYHVTRALLPGMLARGHGDVVNIASLAGKNAFVGGTGYTATKHALIGFSESLMLEVRDRGVRVSVVLPGSVDTKGFSSGADPSWKLRAEDVAASVAHIIAAPRHAMISAVELRPSQPRPHR